MCVCFNHSNLVPTAEPSGDRKQKRGMRGPWKEEGSNGVGGWGGRGAGLETREMGAGDKMVERDGAREWDGEERREGVLKLLCQTGADCNLHASPAILLRLLLRNHQEKKLSQRFC